MLIIEEVSSLSKGVEAITTIEGNEKKFTNRDVTRPESTNCFQRVAKHLSDTTLLFIECNHQWDKESTNCCA